MKLLSYDYPKFHRKAMKARKKYKKTCWLTGRGHGKTTTGTTTYATHRILQDPDIRVLIVSNTYSQAEDMGDEVRQNLERPEIVERYGVQQPPTSPKTDPKTKYRWTNGKLSVRDRTRVGKESTLTCMGVFGPVISKHNELIILDDIVDADIADSPHQRRKLKKWLLKTLLPCLEPEGEVHVVGTRWHPKDIYQTVIDEMDEFHVMIDKALTEHEDGTYEALWEERFSVEQLLAIKKERGSIIFNMSYQNDVELAKGKIFRPEWMQFVKAEDVPTGGVFIQAFDLAISEEPDADYFATCTVQVVRLEGELRFYVIDAFRKRGMSFLQQGEFVRKNSGIADKIVIEEVQYQKALKQVALSKGLPVKGYTPGNKSKTRRAYPLSSYFENKQVFFVDSVNTRAMKDELLEFPDGDHDDWFDTVEMAISEGASAAAGVSLHDLDDYDKKTVSRKGTRHKEVQLDGSDKKDEVREQYIKEGTVYPTCKMRGKVIEEFLSIDKNPCLTCPGHESCIEGRTPTEDIEQYEEQRLRERIINDDSAWR